MDVKKEHILILMVFVSTICFSVGFFITNYMIFQHSIEDIRDHQYAEEMAEIRKLELDEKIMSQLHRIEEKVEECQTVEIIQN